VNFLADIKFTPLWSDWLVYLLFFTLAVAFFYVRRHEHLLSPWRQIARRKLAMIALIVLSLYAVIGFIDSIHFKVALPKQDSSQQTQYSAETLSVLDVILKPIRENDEKTFSAPFALTLFAKENIDVNGKTIRDYPRLKYGGAHLESVDERAADVFTRFLHGSARALVLLAVLVLLALIYDARRKGIMIAAAIHRLVRGEYEIPARTIVLTIGLFIWVGMVLAHLAPYYHVLGTDKVGQDVLYLSLKSIRTGLIIGTLSPVIMLPFAILLGVMAGYFRGWVDDVIQYVYTTLNSIPGILLIAAFVLMIQVIIDNNPDMFSNLAARADAKLLALCLILGITSWTGLCRLLRAETLKLREIDYIQASLSFGVRNMRILTRHLVPNVMHIVMIIVVIDFSGLVLAEAVLAYVGVGVDPSINSWGNMINSARLEMAREPIVWWSLVAAFMFMFVLVLAANLFSDAVRDAFDPRLRK